MILITHYIINFIIRKRTIKNMYKWNENKELCEKFPNDMQICVCCGKINYDFFKIIVKYDSVKHNFVAMSYNDDFSLTMVYKQIENWYEDKIIEMLYKNNVYSFDEIINKRRII